MRHLDLIKLLDNKPNKERLNIILGQLKDLAVDCSLQAYATGTNLFVDLGTGSKKIGVSSHFDRVHHSAGANDNGSAIAVCLDIIKKFKAAPLINTGIRVFFFDEEETGLKGSAAYINQYGIGDMTGLLNMEMVGMGDKIALWPVGPGTVGRLLNTFESVSKQMHIETKRFDQIVTNTADHLTFQVAGLEDAFTITSISDRDVEAATHYFKAQEFDVTQETLRIILSKAPLFEHYHQPTDTFEKLNEGSIEMVSGLIWKTIIAGNGK